MKTITAALVAACLLIAGCGGTTKPVGPKQTVSAAQSCPQAADGRGHMGVCAPRALQVAPPVATPRAPVFTDLSNNNPCVCGAELKAKGYVGLIAKANQGTGFIDSTAVAQIASARAAGLAVGVYDFDWEYSIAEAQTLVARAKAAGIFPNTPNTFPLTFDVEAGNFSYSGLLAQIAYVKRQGYRVQVYSACWYWCPHAGSRWPTGTPAWISGYPTANPVPGLPDSLWVVHQFTNVPADLDVLGHAHGGSFVADGTTAQFAAFVNATPPAPKVNHHYRRYPTTPRKVCGGCSERATVKRYDRLRALQSSGHHPHRAELARLRKDCGLLADRIERVATRHGVGVWGVSPQWSVYHRRQRWLGLRRREHGAIVPRPRS